MASDTPQTLQSSKSDDDGMCHKAGGVTTVWNPWDVLQQQANHKYGFLVLNTPISLHYKTNFVLGLCQNAVLKVTVDGGTNRWLTWLKLNNCDHQKNVAPDLITGDMDSVAEDIVNHFRLKNRRLQIIRTEDQNETDFTKALKEIAVKNQTENLDIRTVVVLVDTSGRLDQIVANVNTLFKAREIIPDVKVIQLSSNSLTWLLTEGTHLIHIPKVLRMHSEWCALMPFGSPCRVTTSGLKWNLDNSILEFGQMVSTSNTYSGEATVTVKTDKPLVWSMGISSWM